MGETSFERVLRLAAAARQQKLDAYRAGPQRWRDVDWCDHGADTVDRPVERVVFERLCRLTRRRAAGSKRAASRASVSAPP